jgi:hypothetical protein
MLDVCWNNARACALALVRRVTSETVLRFEDAEGREVALPNPAWPANEA